ncbi:MAG: DUF1670 domain-containing protein [Firmicutes bacterium]|nr:DUF1670 domain-containing protein [Bacillota bacterium]
MASHKNIVLPTRGLVADMGPTLSHDGQDNRRASGQEIARRIYHTTEAVDAYLKASERVLLLRYYRVPMSAMVRIIRHRPRGRLSVHHGCKVPSFETHLCQACCRPD